MSEVFGSDEEALDDVLSLLNPSVLAAMNEEEIKNFRNRLRDFLTKYLSCFGLSLREIRLFPSAVRKPASDPDFGRCIEQALSYSSARELYEKLWFEALLYDYTTLQERESLSQEVRGMKLPPNPFLALYWAMGGLSWMTDFLLDETLRPMGLGMYARIIKANIDILRYLESENAFGDEAKPIIENAINALHELLQYLFTGVSD